MGCIILKEYVEMKSLGKEKMQVRNQMFGSKGWLRVCWETFSSLMGKWARLGRRHVPTQEKQTLIPYAAKQKEWMTSFYFIRVRFAGFSWFRSSSYGIGTEILSCYQASAFAGPPCPLEGDNLGQLLILGTEGSGSRRMTKEYNLSN